MTAIDGPTRAAPPRRRRRRTDRLASVWLVAALVIAGIGLVSRSALPQPLWTLVHVVTLGVLTNAILQWSWYFARTLLRLPDDDPRAGRDAVIRTIAFNVVLVGLFVAMWTARTVAVVAFATGIGAVIAWHGLALLRAARTRLVSRFAVVVRFYVAAAAFLVVGCALAGIIAIAMLDPTAPAWTVDMRDRLTVAHALVNVGGWIGLSIAGTLVTLGPTMLRTRIDSHAVTLAVRALPLLVGGIAVAAVAAIGGIMPGVGMGLLIFVAALVPGVAVPLVRTALAKSPSTYATWTMTAGLAWVAVAVTAVSVGAFAAPDAGAFRASNLPWIAVLGIGGIGQVFVGALTYLLPVVVGGGPAALRAGMAVLETGWPARVAVRNTAIGLLAVTGTTGTDLSTWWWALVLLTFAGDVVLLAVAGTRQVRVLRAALSPAVPAGASATSNVNHPPEPTPGGDGA
jgi:nitrite reductase (NO-forming)